MKSVSSGTLLVSVLLWSGCAHPRVFSSYAELRAALKPGDRIVVTASAAPLAGVVEAMSADSLTVTSSHAHHEIAREAIARVEKLERPWRRSTSMGLAIGGGTGAAIAEFSDCKAADLCGARRRSQEPRARAMPGSPPRQMLRSQAARNCRQLSRVGRARIDNSAVSALRYVRRSKGARGFARRAKPTVITAPPTATAPPCCLSANHRAEAWRLYAAP
jgi:hypothetical protein